VAYLVFATILIFAHSRYSCSHLLKAYLDSLYSYLIKLHCCEDYDQCRCARRSDMASGAPMTDRVRYTSTGRDTVTPSQAETNKCSLGFRESETSVSRSFVQYKRRKPKSLVLSFHLSQSHFDPYPQKLAPRLSRRTSQRSNSYQRSISLTACSVRASSRSTPTSKPSGPRSTRMKGRASTPVLKLKRPLLCRNRLLPVEDGRNG